MHNIRHYIVNAVTVYRVLAAPVLLVLIFSGQAILFSWLLPVRFLNVIKIQAHILNVKTEIMEAEKFCQSCTMPLDAENRGSEKDGTPSQLYCKYCYKNGVFTDPGMTLEKMESICMEEMKKQQLPLDIIQQSRAMLPHLIRWRNVKRTGL